MWEYKNSKIVVNNDGMFVFKYNDKEYKFETLKGAQKTIDSLHENYYKFTQNDMDAMMKKLSKRERELVKSLYKEIERHSDNAYCSMGIIEDNWRWLWDFNK